MKRNQISDFEQQVMTILWEKKAVTIKSIHAALSKEKAIAYNTVGTILERLFEKGFVYKKNKDGINIFSPKVSKENYSESMMSSFLKKFMSTFGEVGFASFIKSVDNFPKEKKEYFLSLLEKYDKRT